MTPADAPAATGQTYTRQGDLFDHAAAANLWGGPPTVAQADEPQEAPPPPRTDGTADETGQTSQALHPEPTQALPFPPPRNADDIDRWRGDVMLLLEQRIRRAERRDACRRIVDRMVYRARKDPTHADFGGLWWSIAKLAEQAAITSGYERVNKSDKPEAVRRRFRRATLDLVRLGIVAKEARYDPAMNGKQTSNRYSLRWTRWQADETEGGESGGGRCVSPPPPAVNVAPPQAVIVPLPPAVNVRGEGDNYPANCPPLKEIIETYKNPSTTEAQPPRRRAREDGAGTVSENQFATDHERPPQFDTPAGAAQRQPSDETPVIDGQAVDSDRRGQRNALRRVRGRTVAFAAAAQAAMTATPQGDGGPAPEDWFLGQGVRPGNAKRLARLARRDPERFADVKAAAERNGEVGPGLVYGWMTGAQPMPHHVADETLVYSRARFCARCHTDPCQC